MNVCYVWDVKVAMARKFRHTDPIDLNPWELNFE